MIKASSNTPEIMHVKFVHKNGVEQRTLFLLGGHPHSLYNDIGFPNQL